MSLNDRNRKYMLFWLLIAAAGYYGISEAVSLAWVNDDAFISFRYAKNLINGNGLVFNSGEKVEGYTNFLWTLLIALGMKLDIEPEFFSKATGLASYISTVIIFIYLSFKLYQLRQKAQGIFFPLAAFSLLLHHEYHIYATGGLETSWFGMLLSLGFAILVIGRRERSFFFGGLVLVLASLSRPDGLIFFIAAFIHIFLAEANKGKKLLNFILPLLVLFIPYWIGRYFYYGHFFANTYYAKSANLPYYSQGIIYLWLYLKTYYVLFLIPVFTVLILPGITKGYSESGRIPEEYKPVLLSLLFFVPYTLYVVRLGGDFMFGRFFVPVTPFCFFFLESSLRILIRNSKQQLALICIIALSVFFSWDQYKTVKIIDGIADEYKWYPPSRVAEQKKTGKKIRKYLQDRRIKVLFKGRQAMLVYYADVPNAVDRNGLTDEYTAHLPLEKRGRPAHEKHPPQKYLLDRKVNFFFNQAEDKLKEITFNGVEATIIVYENDVMEKMKKYEEVIFIDFPAFLDDYIKKIEQLGEEQVKEDYSDFKEYYFDHNDDMERESYFIRRLKKNF
jgi:hypothetical protein